MTTSKTPMTPESASKIQSKQAKSNNGKVGKNSFAARASSAGEANKKKGVI